MVSRRKPKRASELLKQTGKSAKKLRRRLPGSERDDEMEFSEDSEEAQMQNFQQLQGSLQQAMGNPLKMLEEIKGPLMEASQNFMDKAKECLKNDRPNLSEAVFGMLQNLITLITDFMEIMSKQQAKQGHGPGPAQQRHQQMALQAGSDDPTVEKKLRGDLPKRQNR